MKEVKSIKITFLFEGFVETLVTEYNIELCFSLEYPFDSKINCNFQLSLKNKIFYQIKLICF